MAGYPTKKAGSEGASEALPTKVVFEHAQQKTPVALGSLEVTRFFIQFEQLNGEAAFDQFNFYPNHGDVFGGSRLQDGYLRSLRKLVADILPTSYSLNAFGFTGIRDDVVLFGLAEISPRIEDPVLLNQISMIVEHHHRDYLQNCEGFIAQRTRI